MVNRGQRLPVPRHPPRHHRAAVWAGPYSLGRWAEGRGANPAKLFADQANPAGELAYGALLATITPTGSRRPLARIESILGVYGEE
jgi:hypothetical protein